MDVLRTHQAPPGSDEATRQRAASVKAYAVMAILMRRVPEAIRDEVRRALLEFLDLF